MPPASRRHKGVHETDATVFTAACGWSWASGRGRPAPVTALRREGPRVPSVREGCAEPAGPSILLLGKLVRGHLPGRAEVTTSATASRRVPCSPKTLACSFVGREADSPGCLLSLPGPLWLVVRTRFPEASGLVSYQHSACPGGEVWLSGLWPRGPSGLGMGFSEPPLPTPPQGELPARRRRIRYSSPIPSRGATSIPWDHSSLLRIKMAPSKGRCWGDVRCHGNCSGLLLPSPRC